MIMLHTYPSKIIINTDHLRISSVDSTQSLHKLYYFNKTTFVASNKNNSNQTNFSMKSRRQNFICIGKADNWNILFSVVFHICYCFFVNRYQYRWYPEQKPSVYACFCNFIISCMIITSNNNFSFSITCSKDFVNEIFLVDYRWPT